MLQIDILFKTAFTIVSNFFHIINDFVNKLSTYKRKCNALICYMISIFNTRYFHNRKKRVKEIFNLEERRK